MTRLPQPSPGFPLPPKQLSKEVKLCKDLSTTSMRSYIERTPEGIGGGGYNHDSHGRGGGEGGRGAGKEHRKDKDKKSGAGRDKNTL